MLHILRILQTIFSKYEFVAQEILVKYFEIIYTTLKKCLKNILIILIFINHKIIFIFILLFLKDFSDIL